MNDRKPFLEQFVKFLKEEKTIRVDNEFIKALEKESKKESDERMIDCFIEEETVLNSIPKIILFNIVFNTVEILGD